MVGLSGVRAVYEPIGDSVTVMDERSQYQNKRIAMERLSLAVFGGAYKMSLLITSARIL
jgi:protein subunit release factor A